MAIMATAREPLNWQLYDSVPVCNLSQEQAIELFTVPYGRYKTKADTNMTRSKMLGDEGQLFVLQSLDFLLMGAGAETGAALRQLEEKLFVEVMSHSKPYVEGPALISKTAKPMLRLYGSEEWCVHLRLSHPLILSESITVSPTLYVILNGELLRPIQ